MQRIQHQLKKGAQQGFTIVELIIVLTVVSVLVGSAVKGYAVYQDSQATMEAGNLQYIVTKLQSKYRNALNTAGADTAAAIVGKVFPENMSIVQGALAVGGAPAVEASVTNGVGGPVIVAPADVSPGSNNAFTISTAGWGSGACAKLVTDLLPVAKKITVTSTGVSTAVVALDKTIATVVNYDPVVVDGGCKGGNAVVTITVYKG